jgi:hypothetical protein
VAQDEVRGIGMAKFKITRSSEQGDVENPSEVEATTSPTFNVNRSPALPEVPDTEMSGIQTKEVSDTLSFEEMSSQIASQITTSHEGMGELGNKLVDDWRKNPSLHRAGTSLVGGMIGGVIGARVGRGPGAALGFEKGVEGAIAGSTMLGMFGNQLGGALQNILGMGIENDSLVKETVYNGLIEMGAGGMAKMVSSGLLSRGMQKIFIKAEDNRAALGQASGTNGQATRNAIRSAARSGINLGLSDVTKTGAAYKQVAGVFPLIGSPFTKQANEMMKVGNSNLLGALDDLAPYHTFQNAGANMVESSRLNYKTFGGTSEDYYKQFYKLADDLSNPNVVVVQPIKEVLKEVKALPLPSGVTAADGNGGVDRLFKQITGTTSMTTVKKARGLKQQVKNLFEADSTNGFQKKQLTRLSQTIEEQITNLDTSKLVSGEAEALNAANRKAADFFSEHIVNYGTPTAGKLQNIDKNLHQAGGIEAGSREQDQLFEDIYKMESVQSLINLRKITSPESMKEFGQKWYHDRLRSAFTIDESSKYVTLNMAKLKNSLMIDSNPLYMDEMFRGTNIDPKIIRDTIDAMSHRSAVVFPAKMVARRFILGGIGSARNAFLPAKTVARGAAGAAASGDAVATGGLVTIAVSAMAYATSAFVSSPKRLRAIATLVSPPEKATVQAVMNALDVVEEFVTNNPEEK